MSTPRASRPYMPGYGEYATRGRGFIPWSWARERLEGAHNYWVATVRPDGRPHVMPVWGLWLDGRFLFSTAPGSRKAKNLAENVHVAVQVEPAEKAVIVEGIAGELADPSLLERFKKAYDAKYNWDIEIGVGGIYAVRPVIAFGILEDTDDDTDCLTRWTFEWQEYPA